MIDVVLPVVGGILWFAVGRSYQSAGANGGGRYSEPFHDGDPNRQRWIAADTRVLTTERELAALDREIELYEKQARLKDLRDEAGES